MSFVQTNFPLPSVTGKSGAIMPYPFAPGRCAVDVKSGIRKQQSVIRPIVQRTKLSIVPPNRSLGELAGFWSGTIAALTGAVKGFAVGGPAGAIAGAAGGRIQDAENDKAKKAAAAVQQGPSGNSNGLGPLAGASTGTIVGVGLGFTALILVLASRGR
jgi:hypothetical protein